jgi:hypothetical protein
MNYVVTWVPVAEQDLATVWLAAPDRTAVALSAHQLDVTLGDDPLSFGESRRSSVHRVGFDPPLGIEFEVIEDDKKVLVQGVWLIR